jgi:hypothetical protein
MFYDLSIFNKTNNEVNFPHYFTRYSLFRIVVENFPQK